MFSVARDFSFAYAHRLLNYDGKCRRLHGHNAKARLVVYADDSELNEQGMALDFVQMKKTIGTWLEDELDHRTFLCKDDPLVEALRTLGEEPILVDGNPTAEIFAKMIFERAESLGLKVKKVDFWETPKCRATYSKK